MSELSRNESSPESRSSVEIHVYPKKGQVEVPVKNRGNIPDGDFAIVRRLLDLDAKGDNFKTHEERREYRHSLPPRERFEFERNQFRRNELFEAAEVYQAVGYDLGGSEPIERLEEVVNQVKESKDSHLDSEVGQDLEDRLKSLSDKELSLLIDPRLTQQIRDDGQLASRSLYNEELASIIGPELQTLRGELLGKFRDKDVSQFSTQELRDMGDKEFGNLILSDAERLGNLLKGIGSHGEQIVNYGMIKDDPNGETADEKKLKIISQFERVAVAILDHEGDQRTKETIGVHYNPEEEKNKAEISKGAIPQSRQRMQPPIKRS